MKEEHRRHLRYQDGIIRGLKNELAKAHAETVSVRKIWSDVMDDLDREHLCEIHKKDQQIKKLKDRILEVERQRDQVKDELRETKQELQVIRLELEDAKGSIRKLTAQVNKDFENSSIPSSQQGAGKKRHPICTYDISGYACGFHQCKR